MLGSPSCLIVCPVEYPTRALCPPKWVPASPHAPSDHCVAAAAFGPPSDPQLHQHPQTQFLCTATSIALVATYVRLLVAVRLEADRVNRRKLTRYRWFQQTHAVNTRLAHFSVGIRRRLICKAFRLRSLFVLGFIRPSHKSFIFSSIASPWFKKTPSP